jgi:hypothetical protein
MSLSQSGNQLTNLIYHPHIKINPTDFNHTQSKNTTPHTTTGHKQIPIPLHHRVPVYYIKHPLAPFYSVYIYSTTLSRYHTHPSFFRGRRAPSHSSHHRLLTSSYSGVPCLSLYCPPEGRAKSLIIYIYIHPSRFPDFEINSRSVAGGIVYTGFIFGRCIY